MPLETQAEQPTQAEEGQETQAADEGADEADLAQKKALEDAAINAAKAKKEEAGNFHIDFTNMTVANDEMD